MKFPLISAVLFAVSVAAVPLDSPANPDVTASAADLDNFALYAQYAAAAYCNSNAAVGAALACPGTAGPSMSTCPGLEAAGITVAAVLQSPNTSVVGYVARDPARGVVVVSFRGSHSVRNVLADLDLALVPCAKHLSAGLVQHAGHGCAVHDGFSRGWAALRSTTLAAVTAAVADIFPAEATVVVTGHSLGAAMATLAAADLRDQGTACALYTYGSPRVGNAVLVAHVTTGQLAAVLPAAVANYRITHLDDPVPQIPDLDRDYAHTSPEFWLAGLGDPAHAAFRGAVAYQPADVRVCSGYANVSCNGGASSLADMAAHLLYFEPISGCAPRWVKEAVS